MIKRGRISARRSAAGISRHVCGALCAVVFGSLLLLPQVAAQNSAVSSDTAACAASAVSDVSTSRLATLARGFNLTGWVGAWPPQRPRQEALARLYVRGFTHVRLRPKPSC